MTHQAAFLLQNIFRNSLIKCALALLSCLALNSAQAAPPTVTVNTNNLAQNAPTITITGTNFSTTAASNTVAFNLGAVGTVNAGATATQITVTFTTLPTSTGSLTANVTVTGNGSSGAIQVATVVSSPTVTVNATARAQNATTITINGNNFSTTAANNTVVFNLNAAGTVNAGSTTTQLTVTFTTPPTLGNLTANVTVAGGSSGAVQVASVVASPVVNQSIASLAQNASTMVINGSGFASPPSSNTVALNLGAVGTVTAGSATQLTVSFSTKPTSTGALTAIVTANGGTSGAALQVAIVVPAPIVTSSTATLATNAPTLLIAGSNFSALASDNTVAFNLGAVGTVSNSTPTQLTVTFSTLPTQGSLTANVTVFGGSSGAVQVATVVPPAVITPSAANLAQNAPTLVINGTNFSANAANDLVTFNLGAVGSVTLASTTQMTVTFSTLPTSTGNLTATLIANGGSAGAAVQVATVIAPPTVTANTNNLAQSATSFTIAGTGFSSTAANNTLVFNLGAGGIVTNATPTLLTVSLVTKPTSTGNLTAVVTSNGGSSGAAVQVATIVPAPTVSANTTVIAQNAPTIVINGTNFSANAADNSVAFNLSAAGTVTTATPTQLTVSFTTAPASVANLTAVVTVFGGNSGAAVQVAALAPPPTVTKNTAFLLQTAPTVVIAGTNFSATAANNSVLFNLGAAGTVSSASPTQLTVTLSTQPNATGILTAVVTTNGGPSGAAVQIATVATPAVITSISSMTFNVGTTSTFTVTTSGIPTPTLSFSGILPAGMIFTDLGNGTATLKGSPTVFGLFAPTFIAHNGATADGTQTFNIQVFPLIQFSNLISPQVAVAASQTVIASGATAPYKFAITSGALPAGMGLSATGVLSGTPTAGGPFTFSITTTDSTLASSGGPYSATQIYNLKVLPPAIVVTPNLLPPTNINLAYSAQLSASGGIAPYTFSITAGALPDGLTLSGAGLINGTIGAEGIFNFTVTATDSSGGTGPYTGNLALSIPVNHAPVLTSGPTATPNPAVVGQTVQFSVAATDADGNPLTYYWDFIDGTNSTLQNPTHTFPVPGKHTVGVTVTDHLGGQVTGTVVVTLTSVFVALAKDSDGDGYSDEIETALGSNPKDATSTPLNLPPLAGSDVLTPTSVNITLNFSQVSNDSIVVTGTLPIPSTFNPTGQHVIVDVGGVVVPFVLQKTGKSASATKTQFFALSTTSRNTTATGRKFVLALKKGDFETALAAAGLTQRVVSNMSLTVPVTVIVNNYAYSAPVPVNYSTQNGGTTGTAVFP